MSQHPNVEVVNRMTKAVFEQDRDALSDVFEPDLSFHLRGPYSGAGDYDGVDGFLSVLGSVFEATGGNIQIDTQFTLADDEWAAEYEHARLGRNGSTLESNNAFVYRFHDGRIAEMWMYLGADPDETQSFFA